MTVGDRVKLHIDPGHRTALNLPDGVGTLQAIDVGEDTVSVLIHFDTMAVYLSSVARDEVEVLPREDGISPDL